MEFSQEIKSKIKNIVDKYPVIDSAIIPCLHVVQNEYDYLSADVIKTLANEIDVSPSAVYATATFYTMFNLEPVGKYHIQVCRNISCSLLGAKNLIEHIEGKLGIKAGETTKDGKFTLSLVECLGSCGTAPVMMVNDKYHEDLNVEKIDSILKKCE